MEAAWNVCKQKESELAAQVNNMIFINASK